MCLVMQGKTEVAKSNTPLRQQGRHLLLKEEEAMLSVSIRSNLAIHLPLRWIAALLYRMR